MSYGGDRYHPPVAEICRSRELLICPFENTCTHWVNAEGLDSRRTTSPCSGYDHRGVRAPKVYVQRSREISDRGRRERHQVSAFAESRQVAATASTNQRKI